MVLEVLIELVEEHKETMSISSILDIFEVPRSTYYRWRKEYSSSKGRTENEDLVIKKCKDTNRTYGYRTITGILTKEGHKINKNTVHSIMDLYNGEIIAYTIGSKQDISFVLDTLDQLPKLKDSCILHTDQCSVYTSRPYQVQVNKKALP